ncbi:MAG: oligosaccharide flippase family protein [Chitinophagales bacterium]|nr:oligosaccharide flippase family protein [Chitinophagales bacterium]MCO5247788.1 oligosaccharide flippase family protein [Chitinophagales bacterium]
MPKSKLLFNSAIYIILGFLSPAINFILLPIYTKYLEPSDYALITQSTMIQSLFANFLGFGVATAFSRFYYDYYKDKEKLNEIYSTALVSHFISGGIVILLFSIIGDWVIQFSFKNNIFTYWQWGIFSILTALIYNIQSVALNYYRNQEKAIHYAVLAVLFFLSVATSIYIGVVILETKARGSIVGRFIGTLIPIIIYLIWYYSKHPIKYNRIFNKNMLLYGLPIVPYTILNVLIDQADRFTIERLFDMRFLGLYGFGFLIASVNEIFLNSLNSAISPQVYRKMIEIDLDSNRKSIIKLMSIYISTGIIVNIAITTIGTIGIYYLLNEEYRPVAAFFPLLSIAFIPRVFYTAYMMPALYNKNTKIMPVINIVTFIISIVLFISLSRIIGIYGICITVISIKTIQMILMHTYITHKKLHSKQQPLYSLNLEKIISILFFTYIGIWYLLSNQLDDSYKYLLLFPVFLILPSIMLKRIISLIGIHPLKLIRQLLRR